MLRQELLKYHLKMLTTDRHIDKKTPNIDCVSCISDMGMGLPPNLQEMLRQDKKPQYVERVKSKVEQDYDDHIQQLYSDPIKTFPKYDIDIFNSIEEVSPGTNDLKKITFKKGIDLENDELKCTYGKEVTMKYFGFNLPSEVQNRAPSIYDGKFFDASSLSGRDFKITIGKREVVPGFEHGVASMRKGEVAVIWMAPALAYGSRDSDKIP